MGFPVASFLWRHNFKLPYLYESRLVDAKYMKSFNKMTRLHIVLIIFLEEMKFKTIEYGILEIQT